MKRRPPKFLIIGPIEFADKKHPKFRKYIANFLKSRGAQVYEHLQLKEAPENKVLVGKMRELRVQGDFETVQKLGAPIRERDLGLVREADVVICIIDDIKTIGTHEELFLARELGKKILFKCFYKLKDIPLWYLWAFDVNSFYRNDEKLENELKKLCTAYWKKPA